MRDLPTNNRQNGLTLCSIERIEFDCVAKRHTIVLKMEIFLIEIKRCTIQ